MSKIYKSNKEIWKSGTFIYPLPAVMVSCGTMEKAAILAKKAAIRSIDSKNPHPQYAALEQELLELANKTGVGPQGLGGNTTAFGVNVEWYPTHIAGMPVAINVNCHAARHYSVEL